MRSLCAIAVAALTLTACAGSDTVKTMAVKGGVKTVPVLVAGSDGTHPRYAATSRCSLK